MAQFFDLPLELRDAIYKEVTTGPGIYTFDAEDFLFVGVCQPFGFLDEVVVHRPWLIPSPAYPGLAHMCRDSRRFWLAADARAQNDVDAKQRIAIGYRRFDFDTDTFYVHSEHDLRRLGGIVRTGDHAAEIGQIQRLAIPSHCVGYHSGWTRFAATGALRFFKALTTCHLLLGKTWSTSSRALGTVPQSAPKSAMLPEVYLADYYVHRRRRRPARRPRRTERHSSARVPRAERQSHRLRWQRPRPQQPQGTPRPRRQHRHRHLLHCPLSPRGTHHLVTPAQGAQALSHTVREAQRLREIAVLLQTMRNGLARPGPPDANPPGGVAEPAEQVMAAPPQHVRVCATRMGKTGTVRRVRLVRAVTAAV